MPDESYLKNIMAQMANATEDEFTPLMADIPTEAEDGEEVSMLITGVAKGGKITNIEATEFDVSGVEKPGLKTMLSEKQDGETEEEQNV